MARRRTTTSTRQGIVVVQPAAPVARRRSGGSIRRRSSGGGKRRRSSGHKGGSIQNRIQSTVMGGFCYGQLVKNFPSLPRIPGIGRSGTVALAVWFLKPSSRLLQDVGIAAAAIAGASFGESGTVSGDGDEVLSSD